MNKRTELLWMDGVLWEIRYENDKIVKKVPLMKKPRRFEKGPYVGKNNDETN